MSEHKFRAHYQGFYWYISPTGEVKRTSDYGCLEDSWAYRTGNYFETEDEAQKRLDYILNTTI